MVRIVNCSVALLWLAGSASAQPVCGVPRSDPLEWRTYVEAKLQSARPIREILTRAVPPSTRIVVIGTPAHYLKMDYPNVLRTLKSLHPRLQTLFLEAQAVYQPQIDAYMRPGVRNYKEIFETPLAAADKGLLDAAKERGLSIVAVDIRSPDFGIRNAEMARRIRAALPADGSLGLIIVGGTHVIDDSPQSLPDLLRSAGLETKVLLTMTPDDDRWRLEDSSYREVASVEVQGEGGFLISPNESCIRLSAVFPLNLYASWTGLDGVLIMQPIASRSR